MCISTPTPHRGTAVHTLLRVLWVPGTPPPQSWSHTGCRGASPPPGSGTRAPQESPLPQLAQANKAFQPPLPSWQMPGSSN